MKDCAHHNMLFIYFTKKFLQLILITIFILSKYQQCFPQTFGLITDYYIKYGVLSNFLPLIEMIISHVRLLMLISHVTIIADSELCFNDIWGQFGG